MFLQNYEIESDTYIILLFDHIIIIIIDQYLSPQSLKNHSLRSLRIFQNHYIL